jgi:hypothetical protein
MHWKYIGSGFRMKFDYRFEIGRKTEEENFHLSFFCFGLPTSDFGQKNDISIRQ